MRYFLFIVILLIAVQTTAQTDSAFVFDKSNLDQKDKKGRKHGFWKRYLTYELKPCDIEKAYFYGYEIYDHGERVQKFYHQGFKRKGTFKAKVDPNNKVKPMLLEGSFEWYNKKGQIVAKEVYKKGRPFFITSFKYSKEDPELVVFTENLYYNKLYNGKTGTFYYEEYTKGTLTFKGYFRKRDRGWRVYGSRKSNPKYRRGNL